MNFLVRKSKAVDYRKSDDWKYTGYPETACKELATRLKSEWNAFKQSEKVTQMDMCEKLDIAQPTFSQYINGTCPVSNEMLVKLCAEINVDPKQLVKGIPFFESFFDYIRVNKKAHVRFFIGQPQGELPRMSINISTTSEYGDVYLIYVATKLPHWDIGNYIIVSPTAPLTDGFWCVAKIKKGNIAIGRYSDSGKMFDEITQNEICLNTNIDYINTVVGSHVELPK